MPILVIDWDFAMQYEVYVLKSLTMLGNELVWSVKQASHIGQDPIDEVRRREVAKVLVLKEIREFLNVIP